MLHAAEHRIPAGSARCTPAWTLWVRRRRETARARHARMDRPRRDRPYSRPNEDRHQVLHRAQRAELGALPRYSPLNSGYDEFFGIMGGYTGYYTHLGDGGEHAVAIAFSRRGQGSDRTKSQARPAQRRHIRGLVRPIAARDRRSQTKRCHLAYRSRLQLRCAPRFDLIRKGRPKKRYEVYQSSLRPRSRRAIVETH